MKLKTQKLTDGYSNEWYTPIPFYEKLNAEFKFDLDPATTKDNRLGTKEFFTEEDNGLDKEWKGNVFCNPPYSDISQWIIKARSEWERERESNSFVDTSKDRYPLFSRSYSTILWGQIHKRTP